MRRLRRWLAAAWHWVFIIERPVDDGPPPEPVAHP